MSIRSRFTAGALLVLGLVRAANAGDEVYLRWSDCIGDGGTYNRVFACDENAGSDHLVASFRLAQTVDAVTGFSAEVRVAVMGCAFPSCFGTLPSWWQFWTGGCRQGSLGGSFVPPATSTACLDAWSPQGATGGFIYEVYSASEATLRVIQSVPAGSEFTLPAGQEFFAFQVGINHGRTTGSPTCTDCGTPVCIGWGQMIVTRVPGSPGGHVYIFGVDTPNNGSNVTWQPGAVATTIRVCSTTCRNYVTCEAVTPTRNPTWGSIKSLYR